MSWSTGLIALVIFIALISFYGNQFSTVLTNYSSNLQTTAVQNANAKALAPNTSSPGTVICDLHITFKPQFNEQNAFSISSAQWQINGGASYNWFNCNVVGGLKQQSWIPQVDNFYYQLGTASKKKMDLISLGQTLHLNLVMTGKDGSVKSYQNDPFLTQQVTIPQGVVSTPQQFQFDYVIYSIPRQMYIVQVTSEIPINGNPVGQPYQQTINP